jgi:L-lactate dehydrogenase complex protein LldG
MGLRAMERVELFKKRIEELGGKVFDVSEFQDILRKRGLKRIFSWDTPLLRELLEGIEEIEVQFPKEGLKREELKSQLLRADAGVTECLYAVAETGTVVLDVSDRRPRGVSLLPEIHLVIVERERILRDLGSLFQRVGDRELILISGPSRTVDIEQTLTLGAHGPRELIVFLK